MNKISYIIFFIILIFIIINEIKYYKNIEKMSSPDKKNSVALKNLRILISKFIRNHHPKKDWKNDDFEDFLLSGYKRHKYDILLIKDHLEIQGQLFNYGNTLFNGNILVDGGINMPVRKLEAKAFRFTGKYILYIPIINGQSLLQKILESANKTIKKVSEIPYFKDYSFIERSLLKIEYDCPTTVEGFSFLNDGAMYGPQIENDLSADIDNLKRCEWYELGSCPQEPVYETVTKEQIIMIPPPEKKEKKTCKSKDIYMIEEDNIIHVDENNLLLLFEGIIININKNNSTIDGIHYWSPLWNKQKIPQGDLDDIKNLKKIELDNLTSVEILNDSPNNKFENRLFKRESNLQILKYKKYTIPLFDKIRVNITLEKKFIFNTRNNININLFTLYDNNNKNYDIKSIYFTSPKNDSKIYLFIITKLDININLYYLKYNPNAESTPDDKLIKYKDGDTTNELKINILKIIPDYINVSSYINTF